MTNSRTRAVKVVIDKHEPIRTALRNKQKQLRKPWITNAILKSIGLLQQMITWYIVVGKLIIIPALGH